MESALPAAPLTSYFKDSYVPGGMDMKRRQAEILLASVILARSTSFLFSKTALEEMGLFELLALRFLLAFSCWLCCMGEGFGVRWENP